MLDIRTIRDNPEQVKVAIKNKNEKADIDLILNLDEKKRAIQFRFENLKAEQNKVSKEIGRKKKNREDAGDELSRMKDIASTIKELGQELTVIESDLDSALLTVPNLPLEEVPIGASDEDNPVVSEWGAKRDFDFEPKDHLELAEAGNFLDMPAGARITGSGFPVHLGFGARLERALINFMLDMQTVRHGYTEMQVPLLVNRATMTGTGQLPKLENDMYRVDEDDLFLIPTAEVPVTNYLAGQILEEDALPAKFVAYTPCFRREAGSYGKDTRGMQRVHQFNKVELVRVVKPEDSRKALDEMVAEAGAILRALGLHYRVRLLCTGDMSFASAMTFDLDVWAPGTDKYLEVSSVSTFTDFQAHRASIRFRDADTRKVRYAHTLNGSGLALPRTFIALLETCQQADGSIVLPDVLKPYMEGRL